MARFMLRSFIDSLIEQGMDICEICKVCQQTLDIYNCKLDDNSIDITNPLTTLVNVDKIDNKLELHFVEDVFGTSKDNLKVFIQKGNKVVEIGTIKNENKFIISTTRNENFSISIKDNRIRSFELKREDSPFSVIPNYESSKIDENGDYTLPLGEQIIMNPNQIGLIDIKSTEVDTVVHKTEFQWNKLWYPLISIDYLTNKDFPIKQCNICNVKLVPTEIRLRKLISRQMYRGVEDFKNLDYSTDPNIGRCFWEGISKCQKCNLQKIKEQDNTSLLRSKNSSYNSLSSL